ncbi:MAG TPA: DegV family protein [Bacilli bacterium]|nr:DegV family protein [Bacilli bacterium]
MSIAIVTDTGCNISPEMAEELGIHLLPIEIIFENQTFKDGFELTNQEFYQKMAVSNKIPTTSQPKPSDAYQLYDKLSKTYDEILSINLGSTVSGTIQTLKLVAEEIKQAKVTVYDTKLVSIPAGYLAIEAKRLADQGKTVAEIVESLDDLRGKSVAFASIHELDNLVESGRVPAVLGTVAKLAKIKPIIKIEAKNSKGLEIIEKIRTNKRAINKLIDLASAHIESINYPFHLDVAHGNIPQVAEEVRQFLSERYPDQQIKIHRLTSVIGVHSGPNIVGIFIGAK